MPVGTIAGGLASSTTPYMTKNVREICGTTPDALLCMLVRNEYNGRYVTISEKSVNYGGLPAFAMRRSRVRSPSAPPISPAKTATYLPVLTRHHPKHGSCGDLREFPIRFAADTTIPISGAL